MSEVAVGEPKMDPAGREIWTVNHGLGAVMLPVLLDDILLSYREGDNLILEMADGRSLLIQEFFALDVVGEIALLVYDGSNGVIALQVTEDGHVAYLEPLSRNRLDEMFDVERPPASEEQSEEEAEFGAETELEEVEEESESELEGVQEESESDQGQEDDEVDTSSTRTIEGRESKTALVRPVLEEAGFLANQPVFAQSGSDGGGWLDNIPGGGWTLLGGALLVAAGVAAAGGDDDEETESSADALDRILDSPDSLTVARASIAGLDSVTVDNLVSLRTVLEAELDSAHGDLAGLEDEDRAVQRQRLQALIDTVNEVVDFEEGESVLFAESGSLRLDIDSQSDGTDSVDRVVYIVQDDSLLPSEIRYAADSNQAPVDAAAIGSNPDELSQYHRIERFEYDQDHNVVSRTVDDSGTAGVAVDGSVDTVERYATPDPDDDDGTAGITNPNLLRSVETRTYEDVDNDGTADRLHYIEYDGDDDADDAPDGTADRRDTYVYDTSVGDSPVRIEVDEGVDGIPNGVTEYQYDANGRLRTVDSDPDGNGTTNERREYFYDSDGSVARERISENTDDAGSFDLVSTLYFDGTGEGHDYTVFDGMASEDLADGTVDRLKFVDGRVFTLTMTDTLAQEFVGLKTIELAGDADGTDGGTTFTISDSQLTTIANGEQDYELTIDGDGNDEVQFAGDAIYRTGLSDDSGRDEFQGTGGKIFVGSTVRISGVVDPLEALLVNLDEATVEMFELAGVSGITAGSLANIRAAVGAYGAETMPALLSLTATQVGALVKTVRDLVPDGETIGAANAANPGTLLLEINEDSDAPFVRRIEIAQDAATLQPTSVTISHDVNGDGTYERVEADSNADGTAETIRYDDEGGTADGDVDRIERDTDLDGTIDSSGTLIRDGGVLVAVLYDDGNDGSPDRLVFEDDFDRTYVLDPIDAVGFQGLASIQMSGGGTSLLITDVALTALAGSLPNYQLVISGGQDDAVIIGDETLEDDGTNVAGERTYTGTSGRILIQSGIQIVETSSSALQEILEDPSAEGNDEAKYRSAGITGVTAANLSSVQTVLEALDDTTTPARTSLTLQQALALTGIVVNEEIIPVGGRVSSAMYLQGTAGSATRLTIRVDTDGAAGDEREAVIDLDDATLAPTAVSLREDTDGDGAFNNRISEDSDSDGNYETVTTDTDGDGNAESIAYDPDDDGTVEYTLHDDGEGTSGDDGTPDRVEFADGEAHSLTLTDALAGDFAGIGRIDLADDVGGSNGATTLAISDAQLTLLAGGASSYELVIDGESNDAVVFTGDVIYQTGNVVDGRDEYRGTDGKILVASDVQVTGAVDPLSAVLQNLDYVTQEMLELTSLTGITASNADSVRAIIGAFDSASTPARADLTQAQVQQLVDIVNNIDFVPANARIIVAVWSGDVLTLGVSTTGGPATELRNELTLNPTSLEVQGVTYGYNADADLFFERVEVDSDYDGTIESVTYDEDDDSSIDRIVFDSNDDGTFDRLELGAGADDHYALGTAEAAELVGLSEVSIAGGDGETTLAITDAALTVLAGSASSYDLTITGGSDDTVYIGDNTLQDGGTNAAEQRIYMGTNGRILVQSGVQIVEGARLAFEEILAAPSAAGNDLAKYHLAGFAGATDGNLANVQTVLEAWDGTTTPMRTALSMAQAQSLAGIAFNVALVPTGATVAEATYAAGSGGTADTLTLEVDADGAGGNERQAVIHLDATTFAPTLIVMNEDTDNDGTFDNRISRDEDGDSVFETVFSDADADGTPERVEFDPDDDGTVEYTLFDGTGTSNEDGTPDRLEFTDAQAHILTLTEGIVRDLAGVGTIDFADDVAGTNGETTLSISDAQLTLLAGGASGYQLVIDGESNDTLELHGNAIYRTGNTVSGRHEYQGTDGTILVAADVEVTGAVEPLLAVLRNVDTATVEMFGLTGVTGVTAGNLDYVKTVLEAFTASTTPARASLTASQVQMLVDLVSDTDTVPSGSTIESADWSGNILTLGINTDSNSDVEQRVELTLNAASLAVTDKTTRYDDDADGTYERVAIDADVDGNAESISFDPNDDGTFEYTLNDGDGTGNDDGTLDELVFTDGVSYVLNIGVAEAGEIAGITAIDLAGGSGTRQILLGDAALTRLADRDGDGTPDSGYVLTIDGSSGIVVLGDDQIVSTTDSNTPTGYTALRGTHGTIYVDADLMVDLTQARALQQILGNLNAANAALFSDAGITGVTDSNLASVKEVIGVWDDTTTPTRESLTLSQLRILVEIATSDIVVLAGGTIDDARLDRVQLTLDINTDSDSTAEQQVVLTLNPTTLRPVSLVRDIDNSDDGTRDDRREEDSNFDGTSDRTIERTDADNDGTYERVYTRTLVNGLTETRVIYSDVDDDGTRNELRTERFGADGISKQWVRVEENTNNAGGSIDEVTVTTYDSSDSSKIRRVLVVTDSNDDGSADSSRVDDYDTTNERIEAQGFDDNFDQMIDRIEFHTYLGTNENIQYTLFDGGGIYGSLDGTVDRLVFFPDGFGAEVRAGFDLTDMAEALTDIELQSIVAGVREIQLPGPVLDDDDTPLIGISVALRIDDMALTVLSSPGGTAISDYSFVIDGGVGTDDSADDGILIGDGTTNGDEVIYRTGGTDQQGRVEYQGTNAKFYVDDNVDVFGSMDPLRALLANLEGSTVGMFTLAGLTGVIDDDINNVKTLIESVDDAFSETMLGELESEQLQGIVDIARNPAIIEDGGSILLAVFSPAVDGPPANQPGQMEPFPPPPTGPGLPPLPDEPGQEPPSNPSNFAIFVDIDGDSTPDGSIQLQVSATTFAVTNRVSSWDENDDGSFGNRIEHDIDGDGINDRIEYATATEFQIDYILYDGDGTGNNDDGTFDRAEVLGGVVPAASNELEIDSTVAAQMSGIGTIDIVGRALGASEPMPRSTILGLDDAQLTIMADGASDYLLVINGESDDTVAFSGGIYATGRMVGGRKEYQGTSGKVLVAQVVAVTGTVSAVYAILDNLDTATRETSVEALNLFAGYSQAKVQSLTDVVEKHVPMGGAIVSATATAVPGESGRVVLRLNLDTNDSDSNANHRVILTLDQATLAVQHAEYDDNLDGSIDRSETDDDSNGTNEFVSILTYTDDNSDGTFNHILELRYSTTSDDGTDDDILVERIDIDDIDGDGNFERRLLTTYANDGVTEIELRTWYDDGRGGVNQDIGEADDGTVDHSDVRILRGPGSQQTLYAEDYDADGTYDYRIETSYREMTNTRETVTESTDSNGDGTFEGVRITTYSDDGEIAVQDRFEERGMDGTLNNDAGDRVTVRYFNDIGSIDREEVFSGTSETPNRRLRYFYNNNNEQVSVLDDTTADGTPDTLVFENGVNHFFHLKQSDSGLYAGLGSVNLSDDSGDVIFRISDEALTALAVGRVDYSINIDGTTGDVLDLGEGFARVAGTDQNGRVEYQGTDASIFVHQDVEVIEALSLLQEIAGEEQNRGSESVFQGAGVDEVGDGIALWYVLEGFNADTVPALFDISHKQIQTLADSILTDFIFPNGPEIMTVEVDSATSVLSIDMETNMMDGLSFMDLRRVMISFDDDLDATGVSIEVHAGSNNFGRVERVWHDADFDSTVDRTEIDLGTDGSMDIAIYDNNDDGTPDRLVFVGGLDNTLELTGDILQEVAGITRIELSGKDDDGTTNGATRLILTDSSLTALAGDTEDYALTIEGDTNDVVAFSGSGISRILEAQSSFDLDSRSGYQSTNARIYIGNEDLSSFYSGSISMPLFGNVVPVEGIGTLERDTDMDGTINVLHRDINGDGTRDTSEKYVYNDSNVLIYREVDHGMNGTVDRIEFEDGTAVTLDLSVDIATRWNGVVHIDLASGVSGDTTLQMSTEAWAALIHGDKDARVVITGDQSDTVRLPFSSATQSGLQTVFSGPVEGGHPVGWDKYYFPQAVDSEGNEFLTIDPDIDVINTA